VPTYLVPIQAADMDRVRELLAAAGIRNVGHVSARLSAEDPDDAEHRVRRALDGELVTVGQPLEAE
jgi:hypothetical protein